MFLPLFDFFNSSLWAWHIFLYQILFNYPGCIFLLFVSESSIFKTFLPIDFQALLSIPYDLSLSLYSRLRFRESSNYVSSKYLCFWCIFLVIFFIPIDSSLLRRWIVLQRALFVFCIGFDIQMTCLFNYLSLPWSFQGIPKLQPQW